MTTRLAALALLATTAAAAAQGYEPFPTVGGAPRVDLPAIRQSAPAIPTLVAPDVPALGAAGLSRSGVAPADSGSASRAARLAAEAESRRAAQGRPAAPAPAAAAASRPQPRLAVGQTVSGRAEVHDGHSLAVRGEPIRLDGVEAPATAQTCTTRSGTAWRCGERSRDRLAALAGGAEVSCVVAAPAGGGSAARCSTRSVADLGSILVSEGMAVPNAAGRDRYARELRSAVAARAGLWSGGFEDPARWRSAHPAR